MAIPRKQVVDPDRPGVYHTFSRCVRRAFLLQDGRSDRREWLESHLYEVLERFAFDLYAFAVLGNHFHLVVASDPERARRWTPREVAERWLALFPAKWLRRKRGVPVDAPPTDEEVEALLADRDHIEVLRRRLHNLSWLLKTLKEPIARRANREDEVRGHFWEGRYGACELLDDVAIVAVCAYVDLNEVRAGSADTPANSTFSSGCRRAMTKSDDRADQTGGVEAIGLRPIPGLDDRDYLELLEVRQNGGPTPRRSRAIPPVFDRIEVSEQRWRAFVGGCGRAVDDRVGVGSVAGSPESVSRAAIERGNAWLWNVLSRLWSDQFGGTPPNPFPRYIDSDPLCQVPPEMTD